MSNSEQDLYLRAVSQLSQGSDYWAVLFDHETASTDPALTQFAHGYVCYCVVIYTCPCVSVRARDVWCHVCARGTLTCACTRGARECVHTRAVCLCLRVCTLAY